MARRMESSCKCFHTSKGTEFRQERTWRTSQLPAWRSHVAPTSTHANDRVFMEYAHATWFVPFLKPPVWQQRTVRTWRQRCLKPTFSRCRAGCLKMLPWIVHMLKVGFPLCHIPKFVLTTFYASLQTDNPASPELYQHPSRKHLPVKKCCSTHTHLKLECLLFLDPRWCSGQLFTRHMSPLQQPLHDIWTPARAWSHMDSTKNLPDPAPTTGSMCSRAHC